MNAKYQKPLKCIVIEYIILWSCQVLQMVANQIWIKGMGREEESDKNKFEFLKKQNGCKMENMENGKWTPED